MLKFFRRIRQKLLNKGSFSEYLLYAIGEILLVVIGILLALQINNWNEDQKKRKLEYELLSELRATITSDLTTEQRKTRGNKRVVNSIQTIKSHIDTNLPFHDSLGSHFARFHEHWGLTIRKDAYENIKSHGLRFIKDDTIKSLLIAIYENEYYNNRVYNETREYKNSIIVPIYTDFFEFIPDWTSKSVLPYDFEALRNDKRYINMLNTYLIKYKTVLRMQELQFSRMEELDRRLLVEMNQ